MRLLYVHHKMPDHRPGGMSVHIAYSTEALRVLGHEVQVLPMLGEATGPAKTPGPERQRSALRKQIARFGYEPRCFVRYPMRMYKLWRAIKAYRPDVLLVRYEALELSAVPLAKGLGLPILFELNATSFEFKQWRSSDVYIYPLTTTVETAMLKSSDGILVISEGLKKMLAQTGLPADLMTVNPNGADPDKFNPSHSGQAVRERLHLDGAFVVGFLGSFKQWHDVGTVFDIMPAILGSNANVRFLFAGGSLDDIEPQLRAKLAGWEDRVVFTGPFSIPDAPGYLAVMDIALSLFPHIEPFNASVIKMFEYMAAGKAMICTAIGQQAELVEDGVNGLLVPPSDAKALQEKVQLLIDDPDLRQQLGVEARQQLLGNYTWKHNARRIIQVCEQAIQRRQIRS